MPAGTVPTGCASARPTALRRRTHHAARPSRLDASGRMVAEGGGDDGQPLHAAARPASRPRCLALARRGRRRRKWRDGDPRRSMAAQANGLDRRLRIGEALAVVTVSRSWPPTGQGWTRSRPPATWRCGGDGEPALARRRAECGGARRRRLAGRHPRTGRRGRARAAGRARLLRLAPRAAGRAAGVRGAQGPARQAGAARRGVDGGPVGRRGRARGGPARRASPGRRVGGVPLPVPRLRGRGRRGGPADGRPGRPPVAGRRRAAPGGRRGRPARRAGGAARPLSGGRTTPSRCPG